MYPRTSTRYGCESFFKGLMQTFTKAFAAPILSMYPAKPPAVMMMRPMPEICFALIDFRRLKISKNTKPVVLTPLGKKP